MYIIVLTNTGRPLTYVNFIWCVGQFLLVFLQKEGQKEDGTVMKKARARQRVRKRHRSATVSSVNEGEVKDS